MPDLSVRTAGAPVRRIANADARFWKEIHVPTLPKVGDELELSTDAFAFLATVKRVDWRDDKGCFVVACQYAKRSMTSEEYESLNADPNWTMKPLLAAE